MADKRDRERREFMDPDAHLATQTSSGGKLCLKFPGKAPRFEPKNAGTYLLDVYPFKAGKKYPAPEGRGKFVPNVSYCFHYGVGPNKDTVLCPGRTYREKCFVCEYRAKMGSGPDRSKEVEEALKNLLPKDRQIWNVFNHDEKEKGWQIWEVSFHLFGRNVAEKIQLSRPKDRERYKTYWHPGVKGMTLKVQAKEESSPRGKYLDFSQIEFADRGPKLIARLDGLPDPWPLDECLKTTAYDEVKKMFLAVGGDDEAEDTDDDEDDDDLEGQDDEDDTDDEDDDEEEDAENDDGDDEGEDDGDEDEEGDEEDEEEEVTAPAAKGDKVRFKNKAGIKFTGKVVSVNDNESYLKVKEPDGEIHKVPFDRVLKNLTNPF